MEQPPVDIKPETDGRLITYSKRKDKITRFFIFRLSLTRKHCGKVVLQEGRSQHLLVFAAIANFH